MSEEEYDEITKSVFEHIMKAKKQAIKANIKVNTIVIDKEVAIVNGFYFVDSNHSITDVPTMILGLKVVYSDNLSEELGINTNFALLEKKEYDSSNDLEKYTTEELLDEINKRIRGNEE